MKDTIITDNVQLLKDTIVQINHYINFSQPSGENGQLTTNIITLIIALVAGLIALYQVKSNVISNSRIKWIENLRETLSDYCSEAKNCTSIIQNFIFKCKGKTKDEINKLADKFYKQYSDSSDKLEKISSKVLLYLNSEKANHKELETLLEKNQNHLHKEKWSDLDQDLIEKEIKEIVHLSKLIFNEEWTKSKRLFRI